MNNTVRNLFLIIFTLICPNLLAYDCIVDGIYYNRIGTTEFEVAPLKGWRDIDANAEAYKGSVKIPSSVVYKGKTFQVTGIGEYAFYGCTLVSITIPSSVKYMGKCAFSGCKLSSFDYLGDLTAWCKIQFDANTSNPIEITHHLFIKGKEIKDLQVPQDVTSICSYAFRGCWGITSATIPNNVTSIGENVFDGCSNLQVVNLSENLSIIESNTFIRCTSLTSITIPENVTYISSNAFKNCSSLVSIKLPENLTYIANHVFYGCTSLKSINLPPRCRFWQGAFQGCKSLKFIDIPKTTSIISEAFKDCSSLETVIIRGCNKIETSAFSGTKALTSIYIYDTKPPYVDFAFDENNYTWTDVYVPKGTKDTYKHDRSWCYFVSILEFDATGINLVDNEDKKECVRYNIGGRKIAEPQRGVNIIKEDNGKIYKTLVK